MNIQERIRVQKRARSPTETTASITTRDPGLKAAIRGYADELRQTVAADSPVVRDVKAAIADGQTALEIDDNLLWRNK